MSADDLLQAVSQALFLFLAAVAISTAWRHPRRFSVDTALFFGTAALVILAGAAGSLLGLPPSAPLDVLTAALLLALPYLLLRLVDDFAAIPLWRMGLAALGLAVCLALLAMMRGPLPDGATLFLVLYFFSVVAYATIVVIREAHRSIGVTRRRLQSIAGGSVLLGLAILAAGVQQLVPALANAWTIAADFSGLACGTAYFLGFAPPALLRRAWQEPEVRAFLADATGLPQLNDTTAIVRALEEGVAAALGTTTAAIGLWDEAAGRLHFRSAGANGFDVPSGEYLAGRAFAAQRAIFSANAAQDDPAHADAYRAGKAAAVLAAPITSGPQPLGVLTVYADRPPLFAEDDLALTQLLAHQAAVILDYVRLYEASRQRAEEIERLYREAQQAERERAQLAREQTARAAAEAAVRARDEFLFVAAHELRTPITSLRGFVQVLLRQLDRHGAVDPRRLGEALRTIEQQSARISVLVSQLLDVSRFTTGQLALERRDVDLVPIVASVVQGARLRTDRHHLTLQAPPSLLADVDPIRLEQVVINLVDNAIKYSPDGGEIAVTLSRDGDEEMRSVGDEGKAGRGGFSSSPHPLFPSSPHAVLSVRDHGVGIPPERRDHIFDRFYQAHAADSYGGMGLGLYISREIVERHGGAIAATYPEDGGVCFTVTLPAAPPDLSAGRPGW